MPTRKILDLSTLHMPGPEPDFGGCRTVEHGDQPSGARRRAGGVVDPAGDGFEAFGYVCFVGGGGEGERSDEAGWLRPILQLARAEGATAVVFDRDGEVDPRLPTFDW